MQQFDEELVSGSVTRSVWKLAWPFVGTQVARGLNLLIALSLVGHHKGVGGGEIGVAALGVAWQLFFLFIIMFVALLQGMAILIARYTGRQDSEALSRLVYETVKATFVFVVFFLVPLGYFLAPWAVNLMNTAPEVKELALPFLRIVLIGGAPLLLLLLVNRAFQATGDVRVPLILGLVSTVCNICVNILLISVFDMGVLGAAWGFIAGPVPSFCIAIFLIHRKKMVIRFPKRLTIGLDLGVIRSVLRIGLPTGIMSFLMTFVGVTMLSMLGTLDDSAAAQAAYTIGYIQLFAFSNWVGFSLSAASNTLVGQNMGAGKASRGKRCVYTAALWGLLWSIILGTLFWFIPSTLLSIFAMADGTVEIIATELLRFLAFASLFTVVAQTFFGGLMGAGDTKSPMLIILLTHVFILIGYCSINMYLGTFTATTVWTALLLAAAARFVLATAVFTRGRWRHIKVELEGQNTGEPVEQKR